MVLLDWVFNSYLSPRKHPGDAVLCVFILRREMCENGNHCDIRHSFRSRAIFSGSAARALAVADCGKRAYRKERRRDEGGKASAREERQLRLARAHRSTSARLFKVEMVAGVCLYLWGNLRGRTSFFQSAAKSQSRGPLVAAAACPGFGCDIRL